MSDFLIGSCEFASVSDRKGIWHVKKCTSVIPKVISVNLAQTGMALEKPSYTKPEIRRMKHRLE